MIKATETAGGWTFLTNHAHVMICLARDPELRMREIAERVGVTERAVQRIIADLELDGYVSRSRSGRRNRYAIKGDLSLRHQILAHRTLADLIRLGH